MRSPTPTRRMDAMRGQVWVSVLGVLLLVTLPGRTAELPRVDKVELQPLAAQAERLVQALDFVGAPLAPAEKDTLRLASQAADRASGVATIQSVLDRYCLAAVRLVK